MHKENIDHFNYVSDAPGMPQEAVAAEIPSNNDRCAIFIEWDPPNNINSPNIDHYIIQNSRESKIPKTNETRTLAVFLPPCEELRNLYFNITAVDRCKRIGVTTLNFGPRLLVTESSMTSTEPSGTTTHSSTPIPCELQRSPL